MSQDRIPSFDKFWPFYVREHSKKETRLFHFVGTTLFITFLGTAIVRKKPWLIPLSIVSGYGPAWYSHFFIEKNRPATFKYPVWSLLADFRMWAKTVNGTMAAEVERVLREEAGEAEAEQVKTNGVMHEAVN
jgi:hypothetical protein